MRMRRRKRFKFGLLWKAAFSCFFLAMLTRVISSGGFDDNISAWLSGIAQQPGFAELALSGEVTGAYRGEDAAEADHWINVIRSESTALSAFSPSDIHETEPETTEDLNTAQEPESNALTPWTYQPKTLQALKNPKQLPIKAISINPTSTNGYNVYDKVYMKNDTSKKIDMKYMLKSNLPFSIKGKGPHVLIVHTHGSESYFPSGKDTYTLTDVERTENKKYNMIRVGDELEATLKANGVSVIHDRNIYDSPSYNGSYTKTLDAITKQMKKTPSIKVIIDVHRDSMTTKEGVKYKTVANISGKTAAQIMIVMSTGESGLPHPNWTENLKFALQLQNKVEKKYPGLMRPVDLRKERFNMHVTKGSMLIEVGTSANSLQEALTSVKLFGGELAALLKTAK